MASLLSLLNDWLLYILGLLGLGGGGGVIGYVRRVDEKADSALDRSQRNHRQLTGDPDDPNAEGVLQIVHETRSDLHEFRRETRREHREVMNRIDDLENGK